MRYAHVGQMGRQVVRPRRLAAFAGIGIASTSSAEAHSTQYYVSTPFSPPAGWWLLIPAVFLALCGAWAAFMSEPGYRRRNTFTTVWVVALGSFVAWCFGVFFAGMNTAPPPGFGLPRRAFYGQGLRDVGVLFLIGNLVAAAILLPFVRILAARLFVAGPEVWRFVAGVGVVYVICALAYVPLNAMTHGWHGGYVESSCRLHRERFEEALAQYVQAGNQALPSDVGAAIPVVKPFLRPNRWSEEALHFCPVERINERNPRPYKLLSDSDPSSSAPRYRVWCPVHGLLVRSRAAPDLAL